LGDAPEEVPLGDAPEEVPLGDAPEEVPLGDAPKEVPLGDAPEEVPLGDAPKEVPLGDAPKEVPLGDAPEEVPLGDAPKEVPLGDWWSAPKEAQLGVGKKPIRGSFYLIEHLPAAYADRVYCGLFCCCCDSASGMKRIAFRALTVSGGSPANLALPRGLNRLCCARTYQAISTRAPKTLQNNSGTYRPISSTGELGCRRRLYAHKLAHCAHTSNRRPAVPPCRCDRSLRKVVR
jgi:hypothetical protein